MGVKMMTDSKNEENAKTKRRKKILCVAAAAVLALSAALSTARIGYIWCTVPDEIFVVEGEKYKFDRFNMFSNLFAMSVEANNGGLLAADGTVAKAGGVFEAKVRFMGALDVKTVTVNTVSRSYVVPCGDIIGIKVYADGLEIIKNGSFRTQGGALTCPAEQIPFKKGDVISAVNGVRVKTISEFAKEIDKSGGAEVMLEIVRGDKMYCTGVSPRIDADGGGYKIGLVVRDSMAGIGTLTYYCPADGSMAALGHGITDADTDVVFPTGSGSLEKARVLSVVKGKRGTPGEIHGMFSGGVLGKIHSNTVCGVFAEADGARFDASAAVPVADAEQIKEGAAQVICTVDDDGAKVFDIEIEKIMHMNENNSKGMVIHITDKKLIAATGGIVQGMSGSPIIQDGHLVGAVTHVFVNDSTRGYAIMAKTMIAENAKR